MIGYIFIILGVLLYWLAYQSPRTDQIIYFFSGLMFLLGGISGLLGFMDLPIEKLEISQTVNNTITTETTYVYSESNIFNYFLPFTLLFIGLYILLAMATNGRESQ